MPIFLTLLTIHLEMLTLPLALEYTLVVSCSNPINNLLVDSYLVLEVYRSSWYVSSLVGWLSRVLITEEIESERAVLSVV